MSTACPDTASALRAAEDQNADLFWGLRGGGGNFGIVTSFQFMLHPLRDLLILGTFHHAADAGRVLARAREAMSDGAPRELLWTSFLRKAPPLPWMAPRMIGRPGVMSLIEWSGAIDAERELLAPLARELAPAAHSLEVVPFLSMQTMTDEIFPAGKRTYIKAGFLDELTDDAIATLRACGAEVSSELSQIEVLALGGGSATSPRRPPPTRTAGRAG